MPKIIYISFSRLTDRFARDFYVDYLASKGAIIEFWDIVALVREEHKDAGMINVDYLRVLRTFKELESKLCLPENQNAYYVMNIAFSSRFLRVFRLLSKYDCRMVYIDQGFVPKIGRSQPLAAKIFKHLCHPWRFTRILYDLFALSFSKKLKLVKPFELVFFTGEDNKGKCSFSKRRVPINMCDYDHYKRLLADKNRVIKYRYAVYLDVNLPFHNDMNLTGLKKINPAEFFRSINRFFDLLEKEYRVKVVVAAHPTANYDADAFGGREIIRLKTAELVKDAEFVISSGSTSTGYAVLNQKPIIFIYPDEFWLLNKRSVMESMFGFSVYLDVPIYNIDKITHGRQVSIGPINKDRYHSYKYNFLTTHESENESTPEIIWRELFGKENYAKTT